MADQRGSGCTNLALHEGADSALRIADDLDALHLCIFRKVLRKGFCKIDLWNVTRKTGVGSADSLGGKTAEYLPTKTLASCEGLSSSLSLGNS